MERAFQLNENVLRTLTLRLDERLVKPMVAHALGEAAPTVSDNDTASDAGDQSDASSSEEAEESAETTEAVDQPVAEEASSES